MAMGLVALQEAFSHAICEPPCPTASTCILLTAPVPEGAAPLPSPDHARVVLRSYSGKLSSAFVLSLPGLHCIVLYTGGGKTLAYVPHGLPSSWSARNVKPARPADGKAFFLALSRLVEHGEPLCATLEATSALDPRVQATSPARPSAAPTPSSGTLGAPFALQGAAALSLQLRLDAAEAEARAMRARVDAVEEALRGTRAEVVWLRGVVYHHQKRQQTHATPAGDEMWPGRLHCAPAGSREKK